MKKLLSLIVIAGMTAIVSCGPSEEEKAAAERARQDSINAAMEQMMQDSINAANAAMEAARQDSIIAALRADSLANAQKQANKPKPKPKPKTTEEKKIEDAKKVTGGRGR